jgi:hypothetical protein
MRRLRNQSLNLPSEFGGGAADTDMLMKNIALYQMRRIIALPVGCFVLSGRCFLDQCHEQSAISGGRAAGTGDLPPAAAMIGHRVALHSLIAAW